MEIATTDANEGWRSAHCQLEMASRILGERYTLTWWSAHFGSPISSIRRSLRPWNRRARMVTRL
jgi:hypothetical protein